jgi:hypothetical protein
VGRYLGTHREQVGKFGVVEPLISATEGGAERDSLVAISWYLKVSIADSAGDVRRSRANRFR